MTTLLGVAFYVALVTALIAVITAVVAPGRWRPQLLAIAAVMFTVCGVLGILSIGVLFLLAAVICGVLAGRSRATRAV